VDIFIGARAPDVARIHITTSGRARTVPFRNALGVWKEHPNGEAHRLCARDLVAGACWDTYSASQHNPVANAETDRDTDARINANTNTDTKADANANTSADSDSNTSSNTNTDSGSNANTDSRAANVQPCVRHRDGERGVNQPDR
jgi:hypothetical protein